MGRWLATGEYGPDSVLCSTALRARETLECLVSELDSRPPITFDEGVYGASLWGIHERIRETGPEVGTLLVVGHNPTLQALALSLVDRSGSDTKAGVARMSAGYPPGALTIVELPIAAWDEMEERSADDLRFIRPEDLSDTGPGSGTDSAGGGTR